jgi:hypothetical protein
MESMFDNGDTGFAPTPEFVFKLEEGEKVYDDAFVVRKTRYGLYNSIGLDGRRWITALTEEACVYGTRFNLKAEIDGTLWTGDNVRRLGVATVGGKL